MSKRSDFRRRKNDAYDTPVKPMEYLVEHLDRGASFIEPCAGKGDMVDFYRSRGFSCLKAYDIEPRRDDIQKLDVLDCHHHMLMGADYIITNPPWTRQLMHPMIDIFSGISPTWLLFDADWMFTKQAVPYLEWCHKVVSVGRVSWMENGVSGKDNSCWFLFDKTIKNNGGPVVIGTKSL